MGQTIVHVLLVENGTVIDPASGLHVRADLLIAQGKVSQVFVPQMPKGQLSSDVPVIDARGKIVAPGLIDMHVHPREPSREDEETLHSGCEAAAAGGFTAVAPMPNADPVADTPEVVRLVLDAAKGAKARVYPIAAITKRRKGKALADLKALRNAEAVALSDNGSGVQDAALMLQAFQAAARLDLLIITHPEVACLTQGGAMNEGPVAGQLGLKGMPGLAEELMIARDVALAEYANARLRTAHVSTARSVELVRQAKAKGIQVTCEVTPHHFTLTEEAVRTLGTNAKMNPPLRAADDVAAVKQGLADGTIDAIDSDHAPHSIDEKQTAFAEAAFGVVGLATALGLVLTELVKPGWISLSQAIEKLATAPARILGIDAGRLARGKPADVTIIDPESGWVVDVNKFHSKSRNSPFDGCILSGKATMTFPDGAPV